MQFDCRAPQLVTQIDRNERSGFFLQFAMQVVCSPLQRMGRRDRGLGPEQDKQGRSDADKSPKVEV